MKFAMLLAAVLLAGASHPPEEHMPARATEPAIAAATSTPVDTVEAFHAALTRGDRAAALELLAEDALIFESGGVEQSRAEYASHHLAADAAFSAAVSRTVNSRTHGADGDTAWVTSIETVTGSYRGRAINSRSLETMLLRRTNGHWRIVHIHWSSETLAPTR
jgi:ketosteroid isomerase-like protein